MRGYFEGAFWAVILGGGSLGTVSYLDDHGLLRNGAQDVSVAEAPAAMVIPAVAALTPPATETAPRLPKDAMTPVAVALVPDLVSSPRAYGLPAFDAESAPPAGSAIALATDAAPPFVPAPAALPQVDTVSAEPLAPQVIMPLPVPAADTVDGLDPTPAAVLEEENTPAVVINRPAQEPQAAPGQTAQTDDAPPVATDDMTALERFAAAFANPDGVPVLAVILVDTGDMADPVGAVADLGFAATVVVNALSQGAAARAEGYRAAGAEVALELTLPQGAAPADVEVAFEAALSEMPQAAMLFAAEDDAVLSDRTVTAQVIDVLGDNGMGLVAFETGLGGAIRDATQAGIAAAPVARAINDTDAGAIARALDREAFRARQTGDAVLLGRLDAVTLAALRDWARASADSGTLLGPVSAVLLPRPEAGG